MEENTNSENSKFDLASLQAEAEKNISNIQSSLGLPAKPTAINAYNEAVGNPLTGHKPAAKTNNTSDFIKGIDATVRNTAATSNPFSSMKPYTYSGDTDSADFERYHSSGDAYDKLGYSPFRDNEAMYNNKMTFGDQFVRAAGQWDNLVGTGFMSGVKAWSTVFTDPLAPDIEGAREMERAMKIGSSNSGGIGAFFTNTFLNSGYTVGIGVDFLAEELALMGATALTGGLGVTTMVGKGLQAVNNIFRGTKVAAEGAEAIKEIKDISGNVNKMRGFWNSIPGKVVKETADILNPLDQTTDALKAIKTGNYAMDFASVSKTFGAFADDLMMMKGAVSEAKLEGGMTKINVSKDLIEQFRIDHGVDPEGEDLTNIENIADQEAKRVAFWNLPAITTSNKLMYATMLAPMRNLMGREGAVKLVDDYIFKKGKGFAVVGDGVLDKAAAAASSLASGKFYKGFGLNYLKANFAEGIQENLQEAISAGASSHAKSLYKDPIRGSYENYMPHFMHGLSEQFSAQGAETFAGGFVMGMFAQPIMAIPSTGISKLIKAVDGVDYAKVKAERTAEKEAKVKILNELYADPLAYIAPDLENAVINGKLSNDVWSAARAGKKKEAIDALNAMENNHIITALQTGKFDIILDKMKQYKDFSSTETLEAFAKYGVKTEEQAQNASGKIDAIIARAEDIKVHYEDVAEKYPNPFVAGNASKFNLQIKDLNAFRIAGAAWDKAKNNLVLAKSTFDVNSKRVADLSNTFSQISNDFAKSDAQSVFSMLSPTVTKNEIESLKKEITALTDVSPEATKLKNIKIKQLEKLNNFYEAVQNIKNTTKEEAKVEAEASAKKAFGEYIKYLSKKNDNIVFDDALDNAWNIVRDHMSLKEDMKGLAESINVLMAPKNFFKLQASLENAYKEIVEEMPETIDDNLKVSQFQKDQIELINLITRESVSGLTVPTELLDAFNNAHKAGEPLPQLTYLIDKAGNKVTEGEEFDKAFATWEAYRKINAKPIKNEAEEGLNDEDIASKLENINAINAKIKTLREKSTLLGLDADSIKDTIAYLQEKLDLSVDLAQQDLTAISNQIDVMLSPVKSALLYKNKRGLKTVGKLKKQYRKEVQVLNDITDRIKDLKEELITIEGNKNDLQRQADYYTSLVNDPSIKTFAKKELKAKRDKVELKLNHIENLIQDLREAIKASIEYIKDYVNLVFTADANIKKFTDINSYKELSKSEINELINSDLEDDAVFLESYPILKDRFNELENTLISNLDALDFSEEVKASEEERKAQLEKVSLKYQNQIRYLNELIEEYKEVDLTEKAEMSDKLHKATQLGISVDTLEKKLVDAKIEKEEAKKEELNQIIDTKVPDKVLADEEELIRKAVKSFNPETNFTKDIEWTVNHDYDIVLTIDGESYDRAELVRFDFFSVMPKEEIIAELDRLQDLLNFEMEAVKGQNENSNLKSTTVNPETLSEAELKDLAKQLNEKAEEEAYKESIGEGVVGNSKILKKDAETVKKVIGKFSFSSGKTPTDLEALKQTPEGKKIEKEREKTLKSVSASASQMQVYIPNENNRKLTNEEEKEVENFIDQLIKKGKTAQEIINYLKKQNFVRTISVSPEDQISYIQGRIDGTITTPVNSYSINKDINAKYDAELAALEGTKTVASNVQQEALSKINKLIETGKNAKLVQETNEKDSHYSLGSKMYQRVTQFFGKLIFDKKNSVTDILNSVVVGNYFDTFGRMYYNNSDLTVEEFEKEIKERSDYTQMSKIEIDKLFYDSKAYFSEIKDQIKKDLNDENLIFVTDNIFVHADFENDGWDGIAGTLDMVVIDSKGQIHIYDFKTKSDNNLNKPLTKEKLEDYSWGESTQEKWTKQQTAYSKLLSDTFGYKPSISIIVIPVSYAKEPFLGDFTNKEEVENFKPVPYNVSFTKLKPFIYDLVYDNDNKLVAKLDSVRTVDSKENTTEEEKPIVKQTFTFNKLNTQADILDSINSNLNLQSLKTALDNKFEVIYDNKQYKIAKVSSNLVTLEDALNNKVVLESDDLKDLVVIKPGIPASSTEDVEIITDNEKVVTEKPKDFKEETPKLTEEAYKNLFIQNLC